MKEFELKKIANTKLDKDIFYFGNLDSIFINGQMHHVGSRCLALCVLSEKEGWINKINEQEGFAISGDIDRSALLNKNGVLYVVAINGGVFYLENNTWITEHEPDDTLAKKWLFKATYDPENDRIIVSGGNSGKPGKYTVNNNQTFVYAKNKWTSISNPIFKQECNDNLAERKSKPYEHIADIEAEQCYDYQLKQIVLIGGKFSYTLEGKKWQHHETEGLVGIAAMSRKIFHVKSLKKTFILTEKGILYEYTTAAITPYAKVDLGHDLTFYNCSSYYSDDSSLLYLTDRDGSVFTISIT